VISQFWPTGRRTGADEHTGAGELGVRQRQHDAPSLAPFADLGTQQPAKFQPSESHGDADGTADNCCSEQGHVIRAESEAGGKVVNAERKPGD
jgi:hypothetical protein